MDRAVTRIGQNEQLTDKGGKPTEALVRRLKRVGDLETGEDLGFEQRSWVVSKVGWAFMAAFLALAVLGLFGDGPLSRAESGQEGSALWVRYERFARNDTPSRLEIHLGGGAAGERTRIWVSHPLVMAGDLERTEPEAESVEVDADRYVFTFRRLGPGGAVVLVLRPSQAGWRRAAVGLVDGPEVSLGQMVYP